MTGIATSPYDVAEHLRTPEEMEAYLEAVKDDKDEAGDDTAFVAKALHDIARAKDMSRVDAKSDETPVVLESAEPVM